MLLISLVLAGCGTDERIANAEMSTMIIEENKITVLTVSEFDTSVYKESELKKMAGDETKAYNNEAGEKRVTFEKLRVTDGKAYLTMTYKSAEDYAAFNSVTFENGPLDATTLPDDTRILSTDGKLLTTFGILKEDTENEWMLLVTEEPMRIYTGGTVYYLSGDAAAEESYVTIGETADPDGFLSEPCYIVYK